LLLKKNQVQSGWKPIQHVFGHQSLFFLYSSKAVIFNCN